MSEIGTCQECGEPTDDGFGFCPSDCSHEHVDSEDVADGVVGNGAAHVWVHDCADCGAEVVPYGEGWELPDPPSAGRDWADRPSDPRDWQE